VTPSDTNHYPVTVIDFGPLTNGEDTTCGNTELGWGNIEGNYVLGKQPRNAAGTQQMECINTNAHDTVVKNNVCNFENITSASNIFIAGRSRSPNDFCWMNGGTPHTAGCPGPICTPYHEGWANRFLNNTGYSSTASLVGLPVICSLDGTSRVRIQNNFLFGTDLPGTNPTWTPLGGRTTINLVNDHNIAQDAGAVPFVGAGTYGSAATFKPTTTATAMLNQGITVEPAAADATGVYRSSTPTLGAFELDQDNDGVADAVDNCTTIANPRVAPDFFATRPWATTSGWQRDDDDDGYGNKCDWVNSGNGEFFDICNILDMESSIDTPPIAQDNCQRSCGLNEDRPCAVYDLDENGFVENRSPGGDWVVQTSHEVAGDPRGPKCPSCPRACEQGTGGNCGLQDPPHYAPP
jgi:hypothetical protein